MPRCARPPHLIMGHCDRTRALGSHTAIRPRKRFIERFWSMIGVSMSSLLFMTVACARATLVSTCPPRLPLSAITVREASADHGAVTGLVVGHVRQQVIGYARVALEPGGWLTVADSVGRFELDSVPAGTYLLDVRRVGYRARRDSVVIPARHVALRVSLEEVVFEGGCVNPETHRVRQRPWW